MLQAPLKLACTLDGLPGEVPRARTTISAYLAICSAFGHSACSRCRCAWTSCTCAWTHTGCACSTVLRSSFALRYSPDLSRAVEASSHSCRLSLTGLVLKSAQISSAMACEDVFQMSQKVFRCLRSVRRFSDVFDHVSKLTCAASYCLSQNVRRSYECILLIQTFWTVVLWLTSSRHNGQQGFLGVSSGIAAAHCRNRSFSGRLLNPADPSICSPRAMHVLKSSCCTHHQQAPCRSLGPRAMRVRLRSHHQPAVTVSSDSRQQDAQPVTEKEVMSVAYNQQMAKQMGWDRPFEV